MNCFALTIVESGSVKGKDIGLVLECTFPGGQSTHGFINMISFELLPLPPFGSHILLVWILHTAQKQKMGVHRPFLSAWFGKWGPK